jgi:hypothetical protein
MSIVEELRDEALTRVVEVQNFIRYLEGAEGLLNKFVSEGFKIKISVDKDHVILRTDNLKMLLKALDQYDRKMDGYDVEWKAGGKQLYSYNVGFLEFWLEV